MPGGDRTGPLGFGARTGRGLGYCTGSNSPGYMNPNPGFRRGFGRGPGRGFGRGRGFWWRSYGDPYYRPQPYVSTLPSKEEEKTYLEETVKDLEEEIKNIRNRIQELSKEKKESP